MARACIFSYQGSLNSLVAPAQSLSAAGYLRLSSDSVTFQSFSSVVGIRTTAGNWSTRHFNVVGIDADGNEVNEGITGPATGTSFGSIVFKTITSIYVDGFVAGGIISASTGIGHTDWCPMNTNSAYAGFAVQVDVYAGFTYTVEKTLRISQNTAQIATLAFPFDPNYIDQTVDRYLTSEGSPIAAIRVNFSVVSSDSVVANIVIVQQGIV